MAARKARRKTNVVSLWGAALSAPKENGDVVAKLEELLALAKDGQITGIGYAVVRLQRHIVTGLVGNADSHDMTAAAARLAHRVVASVVE